MSDMARYHAKLFLETGPTREKVLKRIEALEASIRWWEHNAGTGMDGGARVIHKNQTEIKVLREHLEEAS